MVEGTKVTVLDRHYGTLYSTPEDGRLVSVGTSQFIVVEGTKDMWRLIGFDRLACCPLLRRVLKGGGFVGVDTYKTLQNLGQKASKSSREYLGTLDYIPPLRTP